MGMSRVFILYVITMKSLRYSYPSMKTQVGEAAGITYPSV
ncbi:hypothetical protein IEQ_04861 [Bacillus cereus BAG6X1-2]|nr:hypothetical protein IEQ_04861 [Bacillus cereus BAG6X1-2]